MLLSTKSLPSRSHEVGGTAKYFLGRDGGKRGSPTEPPDTKYRNMPTSLTFPKSKRDSRRQGPGQCTDRADKRRNPHWSLAARFLSNDQSNRSAVWCLLRLFLWCLCLYESCMLHTLKVGYLEKEDMRMTNFRYLRRCDFKFPLTSLVL